MTNHFIGRKFGRLEVLDLASEKTRSGGRIWIVRCDCGVVKNVAGCNLSTGTSTSCGCYQKEVMRRLLYVEHDTSSSEYRSWAHMKERCDNPKNKDYLSYGGRGISYDPRWKSFPVFIADMGPKPFPKAEIERIRNNEPYSKSNCRWATRTDQNRNKRNTRWVMFRGKKVSLAEAVEAVGANYGTVLSRIVRGHHIGHGITLPPHPLLKTQKENT